jgi:hypothetical protein
VLALNDFIAGERLKLGRRLSRIDGSRPPI